MEVPGYGTSSTTQIYSANDPQPYTGTSYYRLKQTDIDGKESYSPIVSIKNMEESSGISVYPNPASNQLNIRFPSFGNYQIAVLAMGGQSVHYAVSVSGTDFSLGVKAMKGVLIVFGSLGGLCAAFAVVHLIRTLVASDPGTTYGGANIAATAVPVCLGLIVCVVCFQRAFRKPNS